MKVSCLVVDDEPLARARITGILAGDSDVVEIREAGNGEAAVEEIRRRRPDVVFLDIQMPGLDGFGVVEEIGAENMPVTIFATAFDEYAIRAFDAHAIDYLLKPFETDRLRRSMERAREQLAFRDRGDLERRLARLLQEVSAPRLPQRFVVRTGTRIHFVPRDQVEWISAEGNYVGLHVGKQVHLVRSTLAELEGTLDPRQFLRIHRSTMVNLTYVRSIESVFRGEYVVLLHDGTRLSSSGSYRGQIEAALLDDR